MAVLALELNDAGIVAVRDNAPKVLALPESPGIAVVDGNAIVTGRQARSRLRLTPRFTHTRFWDALDTTPLSRPFPSQLSRADLAHAHLSQLWDEADGADYERAVLAVPGWYSLDQLGLILGMARAIGIAVGCMMDAALAAAAGVTEGRALIHLDLHLHRVSATSIFRDEKLVRENTIVNEDVGLVPLQDAWARLVAQSFVRQTRFDPLHSATSEQKLYDAIPGWLEALYDEDVATLQMESAGKARVIELPRQQIVDVALPYYEPITSLAARSMPPDEPAMLLIANRLAALPGLVEKLTRDVSENIIVLPATAAASGALLYERHAPSASSTSSRPSRPSDPSTKNDALTFLTTLVLDDEGNIAESGAPSAEAREGDPPTHILHDGVAYSLGIEPFFLGVSIPNGKRGINLTGETAGISRHHCSISAVNREVVVEDHSKFGTFLNGKRIQERAVLKKGDRLKLGAPGIELHLIEVAG